MPSSASRASRYSPDHGSVHSEVHLAGLCRADAGGCLCRVQPALRSRPPARAGLCPPRRRMPASRCVRCSLYSGNLAIVSDDTFPASQFSVTWRERWNSACSCGRPSHRGETNAARRRGAPRLEFRPGKAGNGRWASMARGRTNAGRAQSSMRSKLRRRSPPSVRTMWSLIVSFMKCRWRVTLR